MSASLNRLGNRPPSFQENFDTFRIRVLSAIHSPRGRAWTVALLFFIVALAVRLTGLKWGLPTATRWYPLHPDELAIAGAASNLDFFNGQINPKFFNYPSLFIYLTYLTHNFGEIAGLCGPTEQWQLLRDFILSGRVVSAFLGAATAPVAFFLARAILPGRLRAAVVAGAAAALVPGLVQQSHFATVDVTATFFVAVSLLFATRAATGAEVQRSLLLSALCAGLAAATKYNAGLVAVAPLCAALQLRDETRLNLKRWFKLVFTAAGGFLIGCPGALLYPRDFWGNGQLGTGLSYELLVHPRQGSGEIFQNTGNGWWFHGTFNLPFTFTAPALLLGLLGLGLLVFQRNRLCLPLLIFSALFFVSLGFSNVRFMRYVFPLAPALCIGIGALELLPRRMGQLAAAAGIAFLMYGTSDVLRPLLSRDPRDATAIAFRAMMREQAAHESATTPHPALPSIGLFENPWFWTPPFSPQDAPPPANEEKLNAALHANPGIRLLVVPDAASLQAEKPDYVAVSEFEWRDKIRLRDERWQAWHKELVASYDRLLTAEPSKSFLPLFLTLHPLAPHDFLYTNPKVMLWKRRKPASDVASDSL